MFLYVQLSFNGPPYAAGLNMGSSEKTFSIRLSPVAAGAQLGEIALGKGWMMGSICPGTWGSGLRGRVTPTSGPPAGTSGKEGRVMGWFMAGKYFTVPTGWSWAVAAC